MIAILAAISIVAYNGIQQRARNSQTVAAVSAWAKAINLFVLIKATILLTSHAWDTHTHTVYLAQIRAAISVDRILLLQESTLIIISTTK